MKQTVKSFYLLISAFFLMHLPFAFAKPASGKSESNEKIPETLINTSRSFLFSMSSSAVYDSLQLDNMGLSKQAFDCATAGWQKLLSEGKLSNPGVLAIADFSQSSNQKRLYVIDMQNYKLLFNTLVAHGRNSGKEFATNFSNKLSSYKSSPGFYITGQSYNGSNGYSLKLTGIEKGINDKALQRAIVIHGADYVNESFTTSMGYIGRSQGCPAVPLKVAKPIINTLKEGACLYIYTTDQQYYTHSAMLNDMYRG